MHFRSLLRTHGRVASLALGPALVVVAAKMLLPVASPSKANAKFVAAAPGGEVTPFTAPTMTPDQVKLAEVMRAKASLPFQRSPVVARLVDLPSDEPAPVPSPASRGTDEPAAPELHLTSILVAKGEPAAVLGGKLVRVGDPLSAGWVVAGIDSHAGTVLARHSNGRERTYSLRP